MVERWSSKPYVWVRFLLLLFMFNLNPLIKLKNKLLLEEKQKYFNYPSFQKNRLQQNFWYYKQTNKKNQSKLLSRTFLRYFQKSRTLKPFNFKFSLRKKNTQALVAYKNINYTTLKAATSLNLSQPSTNLFSRSIFFKAFTPNPVTHSLLSYFLVDHVNSVFTTKGQYLHTTYNFTNLNSFQLYKTVNDNFYSLSTEASLVNTTFISWNSQNLTSFQEPRLTKFFLGHLPLFSFFLRQSVFFKNNQDTVTRFFPKGVMEFWSKNFYILNRTTKAYNLKGGTLITPVFQKRSTKTLNYLQTLLLNDNSLENNFSTSSFSQRANSRSHLIGLRTKTILNRNFSTLTFFKKRPNLTIFKTKTKKKLTNLLNLLINFEQPIWNSKSKLLIETRTTKNSFKNNFADLFFTNTNLLGYVFTNSLLFKYLFSSVLLNPKFSSSTLVLNLNNSLFSGSNSLFQKSNLLPSHVFNYKLKRRVLKAFTYDTFSPNVTMWYYHTIIRFVENCTGKKVYLKFNPFIENSLTFNDLSRCYIWAARVVRFQKVLGPRMFLRESLKIINVAIRYRDPTFLANWIRAMLKRTNFYKYKPLFRYLKYVFTHLFQGYFKDLGFKGLKLKLKGKICVAGNARTRTLFYRVGNTSHSTFDNRVVYDLSYINTFTGVLGFQLWFYY